VASAHALPLALQQSEVGDAFRDKFEVGLNGVPLITMVL